MPAPLELKGCRHDILGHYLKAIGLLRVLAKCAAPEHRDPDAEGWWDADKACFCLRSPKYDTREKLVEFFTLYYRPTPFFSPWNTGGGLDDKQEAVIQFTKLAKNKKGEVKPAKPKQDDVGNLVSFIFKHRHLLRRAGFDARKTVQKVRAKLPGKGEIAFANSKELPTEGLPAHNGVSFEVRQKTTGKKAVMAELAKNSNNSLTLNAALSLGRSYFSRFQANDANERVLLESLRDESPPASAEAFDSVFTTRVSERPQDSPLFLNRGDAGNGEIFRSFWVNFLAARDKCAESIGHGLLGDPLTAPLVKVGKGTPFFPDAIKAYNIGSGWVTENYPFNALDYVLAVEGGFAMRGSVGRTLAANSRRFAAFPFVFDAGEELVDDGNEVKGTASSLWFPLWDRPATFEELSSFISDAQARLPGKEARFSAEFMRALHSQGVDAGFTGWQEFRFKMKISRVPWITTGAHIETAFREDATRLNHALQPLDESQFLDQFEIKWKGGKADSKSPHPVRNAIMSAMETATRETTPYHCLDLLGTIFRACRQMAISKSFRETLPGARARFFKPLPMEHWNHLLREMEQPEFRIARAVASMPSGGKQRSGEYSEVLPLLGSLLPLKLRQSGWYLPGKSEAPSKQAVWTGSEVCHDLAAVLARRYLDSLTDDRPALTSPFGAPLGDVLAFLNGELDDHLIARWIEALSLIGWQHATTSETEGFTAGSRWSSAATPPDLNGKKMRTPAGVPAHPEHAIPPEFAALRTLLELECEWQGNDTSTWKKRRSQQPIALLCQRSASTLPLAVTEAQRWIGIWGVPNPYENKAEKERLAGRAIIRPSTIAPSTDPARLAAAICIPLHWCDRQALYRAVSLPQSD